MTEIRAFTEDGIDQFSRFIDSFGTGNQPVYPKKLLTDEKLTTPVGCDTAMLDALDLADKLKTAQQLDKIVVELGLESPELNVGFWSWCSFYLFDRLSKKKNNQYTPGELAIWIPEPNNYRRFYRHYLGSIWQVYKLHSTKERELKVLLTGPVNTPGEVWGNIAANPNYVTNPNLLDMFYNMYWDEKTATRKRGSGGESPRRLMKVLKQFQKTWDFYSMDPHVIAEMLPKEFDRFTKEV